MRPEDLQRTLARDNEMRRQAILIAVKRAADRAITYLISVTPSDQGQMRSSWRKSPRPDGVDIINDAPHAGVVEAGARPHGVNREGIEALTAWAHRHGAATDREARSWAFAIAAKLKAKGQKPTWFVRNALPHLNRFYEAELKRALSRVHA